MTVPANPITKPLCAGEEARASGDLLVAVDLAVGEAGVGVDGGVDEAEAHLAVGGPAGLAAQRLVAAAVGDAAEFLDVETAACRERSTEHCVGTRRPPCGAVLDSSTTPEVFA